ncbi:hypothetical protein LPLAFNJD_LOCUS1835 [Methylorubrum aminovorans]
MRNFIEALEREDLLALGKEDKQTGARNEDEAAPLPDAAVPAQVPWASVPSSDVTAPRRNQSRQG